jgi:2-polyprenyl-3-methyl-5-hydroxy-6-metoxy-1,4-benzoquinol methylase
MKEAERESMKKLTDYFETNRKNWNKRTEIHYESEFYNVKDFLDSKNSLNEIELNELGIVKGKSLLHLQCHFGQDTLSLANLGANVTGVDFSDNAIEKAEELKIKTGLNANFICCNIYELSQYIDEKFDIIFTSYGTIGWLPDIKKWAKVVSDFIKPGGTFLIVDFHPFIWILDDNFEEIKYAYFHQQEPFSEKLVNTYTDGNKKVNLLQHSWNHTLSDLITSIIDEGFKIVSFFEYDYSPYNCFPNMKSIDDKRYVFRDFEQKLPLTYSVKAEKEII